MGPTNSATTGATSWKGFSALSPSSSGPAQHATIAMKVSPWRSSGMKGSGGAIWKAGNAPSCSGASAMCSRKKRRTFSTSLSSKNIGPP